MNQNTVQDLVCTEGEFVHLHMHSEHSLLDGINRVNMIPSRAKEMGMKSLSITDHGTVSGHYSFFKECNKAGIQPILGMEAYFTPQEVMTKEVDADGERYYHLILLAQNNIGLKNLFKLSTKAYTEGMFYKPRINLSLLEAHSEGLIATSACIGSHFAQLILKNRSAEAEKLLLRHAEIFKDRFFIEVQLHQDREHQIVNSTLLQISRKYNLPVVLTNDSHYMLEEHKTLHELALCVQTNTTMTDPKRFSFGETDVHLATHDWLWTKAQERYFPYDAISNTVEVAKLINDQDYFSDTYNRYPKFQGLPEGITSWQALENLAKSSLEEKFKAVPPQHYRERLIHELTVIKKMGFYDYFLIVQQFVSQAREAGVLVGPGRGSGAGSLVAYALGITNVDPIKYNLLFERFLNYGRAATPLIFTKEIKEKLSKD